MSDRCSVLTWLGTVPSGQQHNEDYHKSNRNRNRKRDLQHGHNFRPRSVRPLAERSGNLMPRPLEDRQDRVERETQQSLPASPTKQRNARAKARGPPTTPQKKPTRRRGQPVQAQIQKEEAVAKVEEEPAHGIRKDEMDLEEPTPKARSQSTLDSGRVPRLPYPDTRLEASISSPSRKSTNDEASSIRSRSPVKRMADLLMADRPTKLCDLDGIIAERLGGVIDRYERLVEISRGQQVIPVHLRADIERILHKHDWPLDYNYISSETTDVNEREYQCSWTAQLQNISKQAKKCVREFHAEANWNSRVHEHILELVIQNPKYNESIDYLNITDARIQPPSLSPSHLSGTSMQSKLVDLAVYLKPTAHMQERILRALTNLDKNSQSINQTSSASLRLNPISVSIETKIPFTGGDAADVQLAVWAGAGLLRLAQLLKQHGKSGEEVPTLPVLTFYGHDLFLSAIKQEDYSNNLYGQLPIGSTRTLLGAFQMVAALDLLVDWSDKDYRNWFASVLE